MGTALATVTGQSLPPAMKLEQEVVAWTESIYSQATEDKDRDREVKDSLKIIDYLEGKQWADKARFARSRPVINKFQRHFWESVGLLTDLALDFNVKLYDRLNDYSEFEELLNKLATHWAETNDFEDRLYDVVLYGLLHSGYAKLQWNSSLNGGMGDVDLVPIAPWNIAFVGGNGQNIQQCEATCYFHVVTIEHLFRTFGETAKRVKGDSEYSGEGSFGGTSSSLRPKHISKESWARIQGTPLQRVLAGSSKTEDAEQYPMTMQKEFWIKDGSVNERKESVIVGNPISNWSYLVEPGMKLYPRGRVITTAGGCVLSDDPNPYWHAKFPFSAFKPYRVPWKVSGVSPTKPWIQMSNIMNRIYGGILDQINSIIEPSLIAPKAAFPAADWDSLDPGASGAKIKYNNNSPRPPEFAKKTEMPAWVFQYLQEIGKEYEMSSSASAVGQALGKKQVPGGDALEQIISSRSFPVKVQSRGLTSFIKDIGYMGISDMLQFYSAAHRQAILGTKGITNSDFQPIYGQARPSGMKGEDFVRKFQFIIRPGSTLTVEKDDKIKYAFALSKLGKLSDRGLYRTLDQNFDFSRNQKELLEEAKIKLLVGAAAAAMGGKGGKK
jgi:hypothetical protein